MEKVPKIVTERLQAAMVTAAHPDADVLTAFSEHSLPEREQNIVLEHLARCSECREVVALALPAQEVSAAVGVHHTTRSPWLSWPRMRWALVAAGLVTVASFSLLQYRRSAPQDKMAHLYDAAPAAKQETEARNQSVELPSNAVKFSEAKKVAIPAPVPASPTEARNEAESDRLHDFNYVVPPSKEKSVVGGSLGPARKDIFHGQQLAHGPKVLNQFQQSMNWNANANNSSAAQVQSQTPVAAPPPPSSGNQQASTQLVMTRPNVSEIAPAPTAQPGSVASQKQDIDSLAVVGRSVAPVQSAGGGAGAQIARAKEPTNANAPQSADAEGYALPAEGSNFSPSGTLAPESARWSINSSGGLQRSMDQGRTWQDVDVNAGYGRGMSAGLQKSMKSRDKALDQNKTDAKEKPTVFRAVAANGPDVWAGGSEGNLYHSGDSGAHWVRIIPSWRGIDLTGDIINLQFADPQHGRIVTSSAEIWITMDAGQTWEKH